MRISQYMTERLLAVSGQVEKDSLIVDIGTDHAYVPLYLVINNIAKKAIAMDINEGPLLRAQRNIEKFKLQEKIETRLSSGLKNLNDGEADTVIIAGMGGILINQIINDDKDRLKSVKNFILQPMTAVDETRRYLEKNGFLIKNEVLAKEDEKIYTIILAVRGEMKIESEINYHIGKKLIENKDKHLKELLLGKIYEYEKAILSMQNAKDVVIDEKLKYFISLKNEMEKLLKEC